MKLLLVLCISAYFVNTVYCKGCVLLDKFTFDKITDRFDVALIKFDTAFPFGPKHEAFETVCEDSSSSPDLIVGEVQVKDYGEKDNEDLAKRFGADKSNFPTVKIFIKGKEPVTFPETDSFPINAVNLKKFIRLNSNIYIGLPGCLKEFDDLVKQFTSTDSEEKRKQLVKTAESKKGMLKSEKDKKSADTYIKIMKKVMEKGISFVKTESTRVENVLKGKLNKDKMSEMQERVNILGSFSTKHDEL